MLAGYAMSSKYYATTAIDYVNGVPHMGHAMEKVGADVLCRHRRARGDDVFLVLGADEHSVSVEQAARKQGKTPEQFCDDMEVVWRAFWARYQIDVGAFVRSSGDANRATTNEVMRRLHDRGYLYKGVYEGFYCPSCEQFYPADELLPDGGCPEHPHIKPEWVAEENYFFRASDFTSAVRDLLLDPDFLQPQERRNEMLNVIADGLRDISVSRTFTRWGFPLPFDETQVVYVWFDALLCYVTGAGFARDEDRFERLWPADVHVIGKGITRFHSLMWPAMLMAAGLPLPRRIFSHGYVNMAGERMSKSRGLFFDPARLADIFGSDGARYLLMRGFPFDRDTDFDLEQLVDRFNADLANDLGNLASRTLNMLERYRDGRVPATAPAPDGLPLEQIVAAVDRYVQAFAFDEALIEAWRLVAWANRYIVETTPWNMAKDPGRAAELDGVLYRCAEALRLLTHLLTPYMPASMAELAGRLGQEGGQRWDEAVRWGGLAPGTRVRSGDALYPRLDKPAVVELAARP